MDYNFVNWKKARAWLEEKQYQLVEEYKKGKNEERLRSI